MNYTVDSDGICPHCNKSVHFKDAEGYCFFPEDEILRPYNTKMMVTDWGETGTKNISINVSRCPSCQAPVISLDIKTDGKVTTRLAFPYSSSRRAPCEVPEDIAKDFNESVMVLPYSENASAALSRRCLESMLSDKGYAKPKLSEKVKEALDGLPSDLRLQLDAVREVGNFGAHPIKDENSGSIVEVEPMEAEFVLTVLEQLFDYYYVRPKNSQERIDEMNKKFQRMGRGPLKR